jgi:hypothetical protein
MLWTDSVVATQQPGIQVPEHDVDHRQVSFGFRLIALYSQRVVAISQFGKVVVAGPPICTDSGPWRYGRDNERLQLLSASSRRDFETKAASNKTSTVPTFVFGLRLPGRHVRVRPGSLRTRPDLDRAHNQRFVMAPPTFALRGATDPRLVQFDRPFATDSVTLRTNHRRSQFMQHLESGLVTSEPKLSLKLQSAHSGSLGCHKVGRPEPDVKRLSRALHDGPGREAGLAAAARAFKNTRTRQKPPRFSAMTTGRAFEAFRPADTFHVAGTGHLIGKILLEFQKSLRIVGHASDCVTGLNLWQPDRHGFNLIAASRFERGRLMRHRPANSIRDRAIASIKVRMYGCNLYPSNRHQLNVWQTNERPCKAASASHSSPEAPGRRPPDDGSWASSTLASVLASKSTSPRFARDDARQARRKDIAYSLVRNCDYSRPSVFDHRGITRALVPLPSI